MIYNVAQLLKAPVGTDIRAPIEGTLRMDDENITLLGPVEGDVRLQRTNQGVLASGTCDVTVRLDCARCLEPFDLPLHLPFAEVYLPTIDVVTGHPLPQIGPDEQAFPIDAHHQLNLSEAIRQQIVLALPMQPLCRADCAGLCPICGGNRNLRPCDCATRDDSRWEALAHLQLDVSTSEEGTH
jgi:uncharacterized protein